MCKFLIVILCRTKSLHLTKPNICICSLYISIHFAFKWFKCHRNFPIMDSQPTRTNVSKIVSTSSWNLKTFLLSLILMNLHLFVLQSFRIQFLSWAQFLKCKLGCGFKSWINANLICCHNCVLIIICTRRNLNCAVQASRPGNWIKISILSRLENLIQS